MAPVPGCAGDRYALRTQAPSTLLSCIHLPNEFLSSDQLAPKKTERKLDREPKSLVTGEGELRIGKRVRNVLDLVLDFLFDNSTLDNGGHALGDQSCHLAKRKHGLERKRVMLALRVHFTDMNLSEPSFAKLQNGRGLTHGRINLASVPDVKAHGGLGKELEDLR